MRFFLLTTMTTQFLGGHCRYSMVVRDDRAPPAEDGFLEVPLRVYLPDLAEWETFWRPWKAALHGEG